MGTQKTPYKRSGIPASRLEVDMLEYQLQEARGKLDKRDEEIVRLSCIVDQTNAVADQRAEKVTRLTELTAVLSRRVTRWKMLAIAEGAALATIAFYVLLQGV